MKTGLGIGQRKHALRLPNMTCCGKEGRQVALGDTTAIVTITNDTCYRIGEPVDCGQCLAYLKKHGETINWNKLKAHADSAATQKRRMHRRRKRASV